jgi:Domain of unknown function (DUF4381)
VNPQDPLASLHPLRQPELIGWWPPAPGWWLLAGVIIIVIALLVYLLRRHRARNAYRHRALKQLQALHVQYQKDAQTGSYLRNTNALLKSVALLAYPRSQVAAQHGASWREFLNRSLPAHAQLPVTYDDALYQPQCPLIDVAQVQRAAEHWIKKHRAGA